eukprot:531616_1
MIHLLFFMITTINAKRWELIYNQMDVRSTTSWADSCNLAVGDANCGTNPSDPVYSIISTIEAKKDLYRDVNGKFEFVLVYQHEPRTSLPVSDIIRWKQSSWIEESTISGYEHIYWLNQEDAGLDEKKKFKGLGFSDCYKIPGNPCFLDGNGITGCCWSCIGATSKVDCQISGCKPGNSVDKSFPGYNENWANTVSLYISYANSNLASYVTGQGLFTQNNAQQQCQEAYGTDLATILNTEENNMAGSMCSTACGEDRCDAAKSSGCWIGLKTSDSSDGNAENIDNYEWESGTTVSYGWDENENIARPPWAMLEPNADDKCTLLSEETSNYVWNGDSDCTTTAFTLCDGSTETCINPGERECDATHFCCDDMGDEGTICSDGLCCRLTEMSCKTGIDCCSNVCINEICKRCANEGNICNDKCDCCESESSITELICDNNKECSQCLTIEDSIKTNCEINEECCNELLCDKDGMCCVPLGVEQCYQDLDCCESDTDLFCIGATQTEPGTCMECQIDSGICSAHSDCCIDSDVCIGLEQDPIGQGTCGICLDLGSVDCAEGECCNELLCHTDGMCCVPLGVKQCYKDLDCCDTDLFCI